MNISYCHRCANRCAKPAGICPCAVDGIDIMEHARSGRCPLGKFSGRDSGATEPPPLPGDVLAAVLHWLGVPETAGCGCNSMRGKMNGWGWAGCLSHAEEIMRHLLTQARGEY